MKESSHNIFSSSDLFSLAISFYFTTKPKTKLTLILRRIEVWTQSLPIILSNYKNIWTKENMCSYPSLSDLTFIKAMSISKKIKAMRKIKRRENTKTALLS
jgi:hypothetical protein